MLSRPKPGEDIDDLLRQQEEFLRKRSQPSVSIVNKRKAGNEEKPNQENKEDKSIKRSRSKFAVQREHAIKNKAVLSIENSGLAVLGEIKEKNIAFDVNVPIPVATAEGGFPEAFTRDKSLTNVGRSIFAQQLAKQQGIESMEVEPSSSHEPKNQSFGEKSYILSGPEATGIHRENVEKLSGLSVEELQAEQQKLVSQIDPKLLSFMRSRRQRATVSSVMSPSVKDTIPEVEQEPETPSSIELPPPLINEANKWLHMDVVEWDKLKWVGDIPPPKPVPPDQPYTARFDFQGMLLPYTEGQIDVRKALHHHGSEPERPGYSLEELFQLTRSSVLQQRVLALNTLANILEKTKMGYYDECLQEALISRLLDAEFFLLLRFALDDEAETVVSAAVLAMRNLLASQPDEVCLDRALGCAGGLRQPSLFVHQDIQPGKEQEAKDEEAEMKDYQALHLDVVKGALRTDLIPRLRYILEVIRPGPPIVIAVLQLLTRLVRHSYNTALAVTCCPRLMNLIVAEFVPRDWKSIVGERRPIDMMSVYGVPLVEALKLLRTIACRSRSLATDLVHKYNVMVSVISYISVDPRECSLPQREALRLSLESLYLWQTFLAYNLATQNFTDLFPIFMRLIQFHLSATSSNDSSSMFGHDHGTALISLLEQAVWTAHAQDTNRDPTFVHNLGFQHVQSFIQPLHLCVTKWLAQLCTATELTFSAMKLVGAAFNFLAACYTCHRSQVNIDVISQLEELEALCTGQLLSFLRSANFEQIVRTAKSSSCLLYQGAAGTDRDPQQLPSLGALMWGGQQITPVLCPTSCIPLLHGLANFLNTAYTVHKGLDQQFLQVFLTCPPLIDYLNQVAHHASACLASHWFTHLEVAMLAAILWLACIKNFQQTELFHHLGLKLVTLVQRDEKLLLREILSRVVFSPDFFRDSLLLTEDMASLQLKDTSQLSPASSRQQLLKEAVDNLLPLWNAYEKTLGLNDLRRKDPLNVTDLTASGRGAEIALPVDWAYLPVLHLHSQGLSGQCSDEKTTNLVTQALQWALLLEWLRPAAVSSVSITDRFCRLATVFLAGSDLFLEPRVHALLAAGLAHLMLHNHKIKFPASFYDLYAQLLEQFAAVSYGDALFGHFILVPLQMRHPVSLRKQVWSEHAGILRVLSTTPQQLMFPLKELLEPCEIEPSLLISYLGCLATGRIREQWCPVLFTVAVHHVATFIKSHQDTGIAQQLRTSIDRLSNKELRTTLLEYGGPLL
ncbi:RNA polymerase II-associated protein 1 [Anabrus simplex]|uniref:RNA polymerase II-associated protein 1 n=1 Tax=Anabrus simplex TaxID=316456 RepID=UPI0035A33A6F